MSEYSGRLIDIAPLLHTLLTCGTGVDARVARESITRHTVFVTMRDGIRLATDLYRPPGTRVPAVAIRTPYGRALDAETFFKLAQSGYVVLAQDCRGTGDSEPAYWDFGVYEPEDSFDLVEWVTKQEWFDGFLGGCGGSYVAATQWDMARHPRMSTIAPEVGGFISAWLSVRFYNFVNAYSRSVGKGEDKVAISYSELERQMVEETLAGGYFNEPLTSPFPQKLYERYPALESLSSLEAKRWLWVHYSSLAPVQRAELIKLALGEHAITLSTVEEFARVFGHHITHGFPSEFSPGINEYTRRFRAPSLMINGWYDWDIGGTLVSWELMNRELPAALSSRNRIIIGPSAHNMPGYHEGEDEHPELKRDYRTADILDLLLRWYETLRADAMSSWPTAIYYLMGANEWRAASMWPPPGAHRWPLYLGPDGVLTADAPLVSGTADHYTYDPTDPTPTLGGSIVSYVYPPGSVDVSSVQKRSDVLIYTSAPLARNLDVVGALRLVLYASSSAVDTDFSARLSDVFPDGRAIQLQTGILRARYRAPAGKPELLEPGQVYQFEIDMAATANRFKAGHRLRLDISSADFPRFDRNTNRGGNPGEPVLAVQSIYHDQRYPSHLQVSVVKESGQFCE